PRVAILDWMMPIMDGIEVCRRIRSLQTDRPPYIIMLTTMDEKEDIVAGLEAGADDYLIKPCDIRELRARISVGRRVSEMQDIVAGKIGELNETLDRIKSLEGNPPICSCCRKIMDGQG
ncbi:MAG: response regulator transcription factor, partial [Deltaproteobacteria bacterium]